ncbi:MAG: kelch repeat-containing protein [Chloroflexota bacterium]
MERDLVRRAQTGDHDAFAELVRDVLERVYGTARLILLDQGRAEGATRDALIIGWREIRRLPDPDGFEPWLQGIVVRSSKGAAGEDAHIIAADVDESRRAFGTLSSDDRSILGLAYFAGLTPPEISIALGVPSAAADAQLRGAFDALRAALEVDDTANARVDLEWRLRSWLAREAAPPDLTSVSEAVIAATRTARQRRRRFSSLPRARQNRPATRRATGRRAAMAFVTTVALVGAIVGGVVVTRIVRPTGEQDAQVHGAPSGRVIPTPDISRLAGTLDQPAIAVLSDGRVLVVGLGDGVLASVVYDPAIGTYGDVIRDQVLRRGSTATTLKNSLVLLTGGTFVGSDSPSVTAVLFDPYSRTFATTNPLSVARVGHTATLLDDGRVLIAGGRHSEGRSISGSAQQLVIDDKSAEIYDPATGQFTPTSPMVHARAGHTSTKLGDGRVLIAGGYVSRESGGVGDGVAEAEIFDPTTGTFQVAAPMITARGDHTATPLSDGRILIAGGADRFIPERDVAHAIPDAEIFDPVAARFSRVGSLITERRGHSATLLADGRVLVAGGRNEIGDPRSTEIFDPTKGTFTAGPKAGAAHHASQAPLVAGGGVLLTGSGPGASEMFDATAAAAATPSVTAPSGPFRAAGGGAMRTYPATIELGDGRVLILGGWESSTGNTIVEVEIFDPKTGQTSAPGRLLDPLSGATPTRLPDGRILIVGDGPNGTALAEVFDPSTGSFGAAPDAVQRSVGTYHPLAATGLPDGQLLVTDAVDSIRTLDAAAGVLGPPIRVCESPQSAVAIDTSRILVGCGDAGAMVADLRDGTSEPTAFAFDRAVRLDSRRIALVTGAWHFGDNGDGSPTLDRITGIYDAIAGMQSVPDGTRIGETAVATGDRLLAFGGTMAGGSRSTASVSIDTRSWESTELGQMLAPRAGASAIALRDGRVLIVGGALQSPDRTDPLPPAAEIFDPSLVP